VEEGIYFHCGVLCDKLCHSKAQKGRPFKKIEHHAISCCHHRVLARDSGQVNQKIGAEYVQEKPLF